MTWLCRLVPECDLLDAVLKVTNAGLPPLVNVAVALVHPCLNLLLPDRAIEGLEAIPRTPFLAALLRVAALACRNEVSGEVLPAFALGLDVIEGEAVVVDWGAVAKRATVIPAGFDGVFPHSPRFLAVHDLEVEDVVLVRRPRNQLIAELPRRGRIAHEIWETVVNKRNEAVLLLMSCCRG